MTASSPAVPLSERDLFEAAAREEWADKNIPDAAWIGWQLRAALAAGQASTDGARSAEAGGEAPMEARSLLSCLLNLLENDEARRGGTWEPWITRIEAFLASTPPTSAPEVAAPAGVIEKALAMFPVKLDQQTFSINGGTFLRADGDDCFYSAKKVNAFLKELHTTLTSPAPTTEPPAAQAAQLPSASDIADKLNVAQRGFMCPLCGRDRPHPHSPEEITIYRNGMKWERNNGAKSWVGEDFARAAKDERHDAGTSGGAVGFGADQHHEHRARQADSHRAHDQRDSRGDGLQGVGDIPKEVAAATKTAGAAPGMASVDAAAPLEDQADTLAMLRLLFGGDVLMNNSTGRYLSDHIEELIANRRATPTPPVEPAAWANMAKDGQVYSISLNERDQYHDTPIYLHPPVEPVKEADVSAIRDAALEEAAKEFDRRDRGAGGFYDPHEPAEIIRALRGGTP